MNLKNKVIVITGATGGIGEKISMEFASKGATLALVGRNSERLDDLRTRALSSGSLNVTTYEADLSEIKSVFELSERIRKDFDNIDVLINCAGIGIYKPVEEVAYEEWQNSLAIGVTAPYFLSQKLSQAMQSSDIYLVLNIGSGAGVIPMAGRSVYCTTKFALRGATLSLAEEFKKSRPHFCLITLGSTLTDFGPMTLEEKKEEQLKGKAYFTPEWVAKKVVDIVSDDKRETEYTLYPGEYGLGSWEPPKT
jgi:uncharacterized protein